MNIDLHEYVCISNMNPFAHSIALDLQYILSIINYIITDSPFPYHQHLVSGLVHNTHVFKHVLRHNFIPKVSDLISIAPLLFIITYLIMTNTSFNIKYHLILYVENLITDRSLRSQKKYNLALGHVFTCLL